MKMKRTTLVALCLILLAALVPAGLIAPAVKAAPLPEAGLNYDQYPALREVYKDYFLVGTIDRFNIPERTAFMNYTYNAVTHENNMKPSGTQPEKGVFTLDGARETIDSAKANIEGVRMIGHTLTWHSQSPNWMWDAPDFDRDTAIENLNAHIDTVLGEFGGQLQAVDVVNEVIGSLDPDDPLDWKTALDKGEGWVLALGYEWVELAFVRAAKVVDENGWDCKLYFNEFSLDSLEKAQALYELVKEINEKYEGHRPNGKPLIEGIGFQGHYNSNTKAGKVRESVALLATLPGISISFTELDVEYLNPGALTPELARAQAQKYAQFFQIFKDYAAGPGNTTGNPRVIERITFWGTDDGGSWKGNGLPMLFNAPNENGRITGKEALLGALWPEEYLELYPAPPDEDEDEEPYSIPGVYVFLLSRGDSWGGANILLGQSHDEWPWAVAEGGDQESDGQIAFTPEKDTTYRLTVNYTAMGTTGLRVRWIKDNTNGSYTAKDGQVVLEPPYSTGLGPRDVATMVPAHFNQGMVNSGTYTLVTEILLDGSLPADDLIGNLAIRGSMGGNAFEINWLKMENVATGELMFLWDPTAPPPEPKPEPTPEPEPVETEEPAAPSETATPPPQETEPEEPGGSNYAALIITGIVAGVLVIVIIVFGVLRKKKK